VIILAGYGLLQTSWAQTKLIEFISQKVKQNTNLEIKIKKVDLSFFKTLVLEDVHIIANEKDTLLTAESLNSEFDLSTLTDNRLYIDLIELNKPSIELEQDSIGNTNFDILKNLFSSNSDSLSTSFRVKQVSIIDGDFSFSTPHRAIKKGVFTPYNCKLSDLHIYLSDINISDSLYSCNIVNTSFEDISGLKMENLSSFIYITSNKIDIRRLFMVVNNSTFNATYLSLTFNDFDDFKKFETNVKFRSRFTHSYFKISDLGVIVPKLKDAYNSFDFEGNFSGTLSNLKAKKVKVFLTDSTYLKGNVSINGLPAFSSAFIEANITDCQLKHTDMQMVQKPPFTENVFFEPSAHIKRLGTIKYKGNFTGFLNDFVTYGTFYTDLGVIETDLQMTPDSVNSNLLMSGHLKSIDFNLGHFTRKNEWGIINLDAKLNGIYSENKVSKGVINGMIQSIELFGYEYRNAYISGYASENYFKGNININEPNLKLDFSGVSDFSKEVPQFNFTSSVDYANLHKLKIIPHDSTASCSFMMKADFKGEDIDSLVGNISLRNLFFENKKTSLCKDSLSISFNKEGKQKNISLESDAFTFKLDGNVVLSKLNYSANRFCKKYAPVFYNSELDKIDTIGIVNTFDFNLELRKSENLIQYFIPQLQLADSSIFWGNYTDIDTALYFKALSPMLSLNDLDFARLNIEASTNQDSFTCNLNCRPSVIDNRIESFNSKLRCYQQKYSISNNWRSDDSLNFYGYLDFILDIKKDKEEHLFFDGEILPSQFTLNDSCWDISLAPFNINRENTKIKDLQINSGNQLITLNGGVSKFQKDTLQIGLQNFRLANFSELLLGSEDLLHADLSGSIEISDIHRKLGIKTDLRADSCSLDNIQFGNLLLKSDWDREGKRLNFSMMPAEQLKQLQVEGSYTPKSNNLSATAVLNQLDISFLNHIVGEHVSEIEGNATGTVKLTRENGNLDYGGGIDLTGGKFRVEYLNTVYRTSGPFTLDNEYLSFKNLDSYDEYNSKAKVSGFFRLGGSKGFAYGIDVDFDDFAVFNTTYQDNDVYYGKGFADGTVKIRSDNKKSSYILIGKTEKNSEVYLPISDDSNSEGNLLLFLLNRANSDSRSYSSSDANLLTFKPKNGTKKASAVNDKVKTEVEQELDLNLTITPDALVSVVFNESMGDAITGRGRGDMQMKLKPEGGISLNGEFVLSEGDYLFTLSGIINKRFYIEPGSRIEWTGEPGKGSMDIDVVYKLRTQVAPLMEMVGDTMNISSYKSRVPVECHILLSNSLENPEIDIRIDIPNSGERPNEILQALSDEDRSTQFMSLLAFNSFINKNSGDFVNVTSTEMLSNQLSNWLSQISNDVDFGINYRSGNKLQSDELELGVSTQLLSDRVMLNVNGTTQFNNKNEISDVGQDDKQFLGDASIEVKLTPNGKVRLKGFTRSNTDPLRNANSTEGIALFYTEEFNRIGDLFKSKKKKEQEEKNITDSLKNDAIKEDLEYLIEDDSVD